MVFSIAQSMVAKRINASPQPNNTGKVFKAIRLPSSNSRAPIKKFLVIFSFRKTTAKIITNRNIVLWMNAPWAAVVKESPLKKSKNGIPPPTSPMVKRRSHCFFVRLLRVVHLANRKTTPHKTSATKAFFKNVKIYGLITLTLYLLMKTEKPEITAVEKTNNNPLFIFFVYRLRSTDYSRILKSVVSSR